MYRTFGRYLNPVDSYAFSGSDGMARMQGIMEHLRANPFEELGGCRVTAVADYQTGLRWEGNQETPTGLPRSNVLAYTLEGVGSVIVRPSGTEPKLKVYYSLKGDDLPQVQALWRKLKKEVEAKLA